MKTDHLAPISLDDLGTVAGAASAATVKLWNDYYRAPAGPTKDRLLREYENSTRAVFGML